ncbi:MAG TPA: sigma-70 family RNA polymerase sigma factor [Acidobacteriaceae bacterium]|jgi:RNA polymerase sigma-70 factor (ECF subfamily)|nr:sigma-70 family RNA polymerase sigma factor [Acidobacteriaceae bacterium]
MGETLSWQPDFEGLVNEHQSMVFSMAWRITGDRGLAEEIAQDVLLELDRHLPHLGSANHARYWLRQVTLHRSTDAKRRRRTKAASLGTDVWVELEERHGMMDVDRESPLSVRLEQLLAALPDIQRAAIVLRYQEEMTPDEIAVMMRAPIATVKSNLQRGLKLLRARAEQTLKEFVRGA